MHSIQFCSFKTIKKNVRINAIYHSCSRVRNVIYVYINVCIVVYIVHILDWLVVVLLREPIDAKKKDRRADILQFPGKRRELVLKVSKMCTLYSSELGLLKGTLYARNMHLSLILMKNSKNGVS